MGEINQNGPLQVETIREGTGLILVLDREIYPDELLEKLTLIEAALKINLQWNQALDEMPGAAHRVLLEQARTLLGRPSGPANAEHTPRAPATRITHNSATLAVVLGFKDFAGLLEPTIQALREQVEAERFGTPGRVHVWRKLDAAAVILDAPAISEDDLQRAFNEAAADYGLEWDWQQSVPLRTAGTEDDLLNLASVLARP